MTEIGRFTLKNVDARPVGNLDRTTAEYVELYSLVDAALKESRIEKIGTYDVLDNLFDFLISDIVKGKPHLHDYAYQDLDGEEHGRYVLFDWCDNNCPNCGANIARGIFPYKESEVAKQNEEKEAKESAPAH